MDRSSVQQRGRTSIDAIRDGSQLWEEVDSGNVGRRGGGELRKSSSDHLFSQWNRIKSHTQHQQRLKKAKENLDRSREKGSEEVF